AGESVACFVLPDGGGAGEQPLVCARPAEQEPTAVRRPRHVGEPAEPGEHDLLVTERVAVDDYELAPRADPPYECHGVALRRERSVGRGARQLQVLAPAALTVEDHERHPASREAAHGEQPGAP